MRQIPQSLRHSLGRPNRRSVATRGSQRRLLLETLENRLLLAGFNDPDYTAIQWGLNNIGQNGGTYDVDIDAPAAWTVTKGSMKTILAEVDDGVDYTHADVYLNIWLNQAEIAATLRSNLTDTDGDGIISFRDLNNPGNAGYVSDLNGTGYIDGGDLLQDSRWANGVDDEGNGKIDDLVGWDFLDNDNDPQPGASGGHGTGMTQWIGAIPNNGVGKVGVNWYISVMPVRIRPGNETAVDFSAQAAGLDYSVESGAPISAIWGGSYSYSQTMYDAINRARAAGHLMVAPIGNDATNTDVTPRYPASFDLDNIISVTSFNANDGMDAVWNWGRNTVDLAGPTAPGGGTSGGAAHVAGVAALLKTIHSDWNYQQLKDRILSTVEPSAALAGKTVTGGRLNAARSLATTSISISDPSVLEGASGTTQLVLNVTRFGDDTGEVVLGWSTLNGSAVAGSDYTAAGGQLTFSPGGANSQSITVSISGDNLSEWNERFYVSLTQLSGDALLADATGQVTILNDDTPPTKFYVVDDASANRTYEYRADGNFVENYALDGGNKAPRGAASTAAGDKVWVVDANKKVYVYDDSGKLLGSWSAGSLANNASIEGIATDGTDVWLVDARQDRVYQYEGAAVLLANPPGRTSVPAGFSFALRSMNTNPKDVVTDGTNLWVVDSGWANISMQVFKYAMDGSPVGSWTIDSANSKPTGLTIDPTGDSQSIWIVDSGTDMVYEYANARAKSSGSFNLASATFPLAAGNTNPQGIADPPPPGSSLVVAGRTAVPSASGMAPPLDSNRPNLVADFRRNDDRTSAPNQSDVHAPWLSRFTAASLGATQNLVTLTSESHQLPIPNAIDDTDHVFSLNDPFGTLDESLLSSVRHE